MAVYVDAPMASPQSRRWRYDQSCHLFADTVDELHRFAAELGLKRSWFQNCRLPHYDLTAGKRIQAVRLGAIEADRQTVVKHMRPEPTRVIKRAEGNW